MATRVMSSIYPTIEQAAANYGKVGAMSFVLSLVGETYSRFSKLNNSTGESIAAFKSIQQTTYLAKNPILNSWTANLLAGLTVTGLNTPQFLNFMGKLSGQPAIDKGSGRHKNIMTIISDRPPFVFFFACAREIADIASKVIGSFATGIVAQKMFDGQTEGKVRAVVTVVMLGLSAVNVAKVVYPFTYVTK